jgi:hypothetical protein
MTDPSDEIRSRCAAAVARLSRIAQSTGLLDHDEVLSAITVVEHEIALAVSALKRLRSRP